MTGRMCRTGVMKMGQKCVLVDTMKGITMMPENACWLINVAAEGCQKNA